MIVRKSPGTKYEATTRMDAKVYQELKEHCKNYRFTPAYIISRLVADYLKKFNNERKQHGAN